MVPFGYELGNLVGSLNVHPAWVKEGEEALTSILLRKMETSEARETTGDEGPLCSVGFSLFCFVWKPLVRQMLIYSKKQRRGTVLCCTAASERNPKAWSLGSSSRLSRLSMEGVPLPPWSRGRLCTEGLLLFLHCLMGVLSSGACMPFTNEASFEDKQEIRLSLSKYITSASSWFLVLTVPNSPRGPRCELCSIH